MSAAAAAAGVIKIPTTDGYRTAARKRLAVQFDAPAGSAAAGMTGLHAIGRNNAVKDNFSRIHLNQPAA